MLAARTLLLAGLSTAALHDLRVEHLLAPTGVDVAEPRFSWLIDATGAPRGEAQKSYRIVVTDPAGSPVWSSGEVTSDKNYLVAYAGVPLKSDNLYTWNVSITMTSGAQSAASSSFRTGLFSAADWGKASWITGGDTARVFRREFTLPSAFDRRNAHVYISGLGYFELECNGAKIGDHMLDVGWTVYSARVLYTSFDLSTCLLDPPAKNVLGVTLGAGWFARGSPSGGGQPGHTGEPPRLLLTARVRSAADGTLTVINSRGSGGAPSPSSTGTCAIAVEGKAAEASCTGGSSNATKSIVAAAYGLLSSGCPMPAGNPECAADLSAAAAAVCVGRTTCSVECPATSAPPNNTHTCVVTGSTEGGTAKTQKVAVPDPCYDTKKSVFVAITCSGGPPAPGPTPALNDVWQVASGPIVYDSLYNGEHYDATKELGAWSTAGYVADPAKWTAATAVTEVPNATLASQLFEPIKQISTLDPVNITQPKPGMWVVDFGQNIAGLVRLTMRNQTRGSTVTLKHAELRMHPPYGPVDGTLYYGNLRKAQATDTYVAKGDASETYMPTFTQHGFRYAEITGLTAATLDAGDIQAVEVHTALEQTGSASFESPLFSQIQKNVAWGHRANVMSVPSDCPQRDERRGWMGDAALIAESATYNFRPAAFYTAWLNSIQDVQSSDGQVPNFVPIGRGAGAPNWQSAYPTLVWSQWKYAGDLRLVVRHWPSLVRYANHWIQTIDTTPPSKFTTGFGDWVPAGPKADGHLTGMFAAMHDLTLITELAGAVGDATTKANASAAVAKAGAAFHAQWYDADKKCYGSCLQTENAVALWLGDSVVPSAKLAGVINQTAYDVLVTNAMHTTSGIIGIKAIYEALSRLGRADVPVLMSGVTTYPSYGYMITNEYEPATTMWELWNSDTQGPSMNSRNHIMFGSVSSWFYRYLCGIDVPRGVYGYDKISIHPVGVGVQNSTNNAAECAIVTPRGAAASSWRGPQIVSGANTRAGSYIPRDSDAGATVELNATIPIGSSGTIRVPLVAAAGQSAQTVVISEGGVRVWADGEFLSGVAGISSAKADVGPGTEGEGIEFTVSSGDYTFVAF